MSHWEATWPTARIQHKCWLCARTIMPGELYCRSVGFDMGTAWTTKLCEHCERVTAAYQRVQNQDEYIVDWVLEWLEEQPAEWAQLQAGWRYPDGELLPLPFQRRCHACGVLMHGWRTWCLSCDLARIERLNQQLAELVGAIVP